MIRSAAKLPGRVKLDCPSSEGRTRQSFKKECDINQIMAKYQKTGAISHFARHASRYDFATGLDFHESMNVVLEGQRIFGELPAEIRARFITPEAFLDFVQDPANGDEMREMGLRDPVSRQEKAKLADEPSPSVEVLEPVVAPDEPPVG